ncbi:PAS domain S-box protein [Haladaptatus sp. DJG-WS-42]|uniref:PAS domain S-box protein n=1 Tax=Haladaptatus sp. DJG-WS-42 TaxID=3120516 RepID=UPI0030CFF133
MTEDVPARDEATNKELRAELRESRSRIRGLEAELAETNEGMVALTLELENARERYQTIFEESTDGILLIEPDQDTIHEANPQACTLLGYDRETIMTLSPADIFPDESDRSHTFAEAVVHGWADGFTCRTKDGRKVDVDISASMVTLNGQSLLLAALRDVTERKRREQRLQVLTRIFRHNLRNDGNIIQGHADLLYDEVSGSPLEANVFQIRETIDEILELSSKVRRVQDILDQSRLYKSPLAELLSHHEAWFEQTYPETTLTSSVPEEEIVVGRRLGVAIQEVIENAAKHTGDGTTITVSAEIDDDQVWVKVADDGPGIPDQELEVIQVGAETPLAHSSGVGLWFTSWVVDSLGGKLSVQRRDPEGTLVSMAVPVLTPEAAQPGWNEQHTPNQP